VSHEERLSLLNLVLAGAAEESTGEAEDANGDEEVDIGELIARVNAAQNTCGGGAMMCPPR